MDAIPRIIPLSQWLRMNPSLHMHKLVVLISAVNKNLANDISVVQMHNSILFMKESTLMDFDGRIDLSTCTTFTNLNY